MRKKHLGCFLLGASTLLCSCVDNTYDLNKGVVMDVKIEGNRLALPIGNLQAMLLDSLISVEEIDMISQMDGVYSISMSDTIDPYEYSMPEIKFSIPPKEANVAVNDFAQADITEVEIQGQSPEGTKFAVPKVSLNDLKIPGLNTDRSVSAANDKVMEYKELFDTDAIESIPAIPFDQTFSLKDGEIKFDLGYTLPKEIRTISAIMLRSIQDNNGNPEDGALIGFEIKHPKALRDLDKRVKFTITFPEEFVLAIDPMAEGNYSLNDNTIEVSDLNVLAGTESDTEVRFYIKKLENLEQKIIDGTLKLDEAIKYTVDYQVDGSLKLKKGTKMEDFNFIVKTDLGLAFRDVVGETNDIEVKFAPVNMAFDIDFDNLQYIDRIEYIDFDDSQSKLHFHTEMAGGFQPFALKEGYALKIEFPDELVINEALSEYPRKNLNGEIAIEYKENEHAFYVYDVEVFNSDIKDTDADGNPVYGHWNLALDRFDLHEPVVGGKFHHHVEAKVTVVNNGIPVEQLVLAGTRLESLNETLESLKTKDVNFSIWNSHFSIDDAVVHTEVITSPLEHIVEFEFENNDLPEQIRRVESIGFDGDVPVFFNVKINGLEDLKTDITLDLHIKLPSALELATKADDSNSNVKIMGDSLIMQIAMDPSSKEPTKVELVCRGVDFTKGSDGAVGGLVPELRNGKGYIQYSSDIAVVGNVVVKGSEFHADVLDKDISVDVDFIVEDIRVKDFHGIFHIDDLGVVEETIDLSGEELDFLRAENNTLVLSNPQIMIEVDNSISIPVGAKLSLKGRDENGVVIPTSVIDYDIEIKAADYDTQTDKVTPRSTKLFFTAKPSAKEGYENICIENLSNLLKKVPSSIDISLIPVINTTQTQNINLIQPLSFGGNYSVEIPLEFDELSFTYSDTIAGIGGDLGEMMEMFSNVEVGLKMNVKNSMPLQLTLKATPLDKDGKHIDDDKIALFGLDEKGDTIREFILPAGDGKAYSDTIQAKPIHFAIESKTGDISALDQLMFEVSAESVTSTAGGAALRGDQGIKIENIVIEVAGDIEMNLDEMGEDKE